MLPGLVYPSQGRPFNSTDFRQNAAAAAPTDWTIRGASTSGAAPTIVSNGAAFGGHELKTSTGAAAQTYFSWDRAGSTAGSIEILALLKVSSSNISFQRSMGICLAIQPTTSSGHHACLANLGPSAGQVQIRNITDTGTIASASLTLTYGGQFWMRVSRVAGSITAKTWSYGNAESTATSVVGSDSTSASTGLVGTAILGGAGAASNGSTIQYFSYALNAPAGSLPLPF